MSEEFKTSWLIMNGVSKPAIEVKNKLFLFQYKPNLNNFLIYLSDVKKSKEHLIDTQTKMCNKCKTNFNQCEFYGMRK